MAHPKLKDNWRAIAALSGDARSSERIEAHYLVEKELAARLMNASRAERSQVYGEVYGELFSRLEDHPQHTRRLVDTSALLWQLAMLRQIVPAGSRFVEIGAGDSKVSLALCNHCSECVAVDVSDAVLASAEPPANFRFVKIDGLELPLADASYDFVYSNQLMEHLHPDDAIAQLGEIVRILRPGGAYLCITPNRHTGPHDVSKYYDAVPTGFHLKEYTYRELSDLFLASGFSRTRVLFKKGRWNFVLPSGVAQWAERLFAKLYPRGSGPVTRRLVRNLLGVNIIGYKS